MLKVHINVGRLLALFADKALEKQVRTGGVYLGNAQAKAHRRIGRRAAPLAQDAHAARIAHDVVHREEVHLVLALGNQCQFALQLGVHRRRHALGVAAGCAFVGEPGQALSGRHARGHGLLRVLVFDFVEAEGAALRNLYRGLQQLGRVDACQPHALAQVPLGMRLQRKAALRHRQAQAHGGDHVLQRLARAHMHVNIARGHQRHAHRRARLLQGVQPQVVVGLQQQLGHQPKIQAKLGSSAFQ